MWQERDDRGNDFQQPCTSDAPAPGSKMGAKRGRRHTAPGMLKTALIRSADGSLRRRPLHSPPCLTTSHPPKSCVRNNSESSLTGFNTIGNRLSVGSIGPSLKHTTERQELMEGPQTGSHTHAQRSRLTRTFSAPRFSSLADSSPFGPRTRTYKSHISQAGALVDIATLEID